MKKLIIPALALVALAACGSEPEAAGTQQGTAPSTSAAPTTTEPEYATLIEEAHGECNDVGSVGDGGTSITFDTEGDEEYTGDDYFDVACALVVLGTPDHVIDKMDQTRALDGTLDAGWDYEGDRYESFWNYHPDSGMNLTVYID